uniref:WGS project CAEQ00000000 data, annotated contig 876 n=1 Tax=Trypanosoma congolense (strain IL3000) TaxID=1068625 RepID=F9WJ67_TRYCI|nr:unnamed protein product [Trypanosoma congolense IL3000]
MVKKDGVARTQQGLAAFLKPLKPNKKYLKKMKFIAKKRELAKAAERGHRKKATKKSGPAKVVKKIASSVKEKKTKAVKAAQKKVGRVTVKPTAGLNKASTRKSVASRTERKEDGARDSSDDDAFFALPPPVKKDVDKELIKRVICGEDDRYDDNVGGASTDNVLHSPYLPFLDDYTQQKRSEIVEPDELLERAHTYFADLGRRESTLKREAARKLRELKEINRRGGDKDGFRYVVPRNVTEVVRHMVQGSEVDLTRVSSSFPGDDDEKNRSDEHHHEAADRPMHRRKRRNPCYSDFYQFQVSQRWTQNAERFLEKGRAHKSMFEASKQKRSLRKF